MTPGRARRSQVPDGLSRHAFHYTLANPAGEGRWHRLTVQGSGGAAPPVEIVTSHPSLAAYKDFGFMAGDAAGRIALFVQARRGPLLSRSRCAPRLRTNSHTFRESSLRVEPPWVN